MVIYPPARLLARKSLIINLSKAYTFRYTPIITKIRNIPTRGNTTNQGVCESILFGWRYALLITVNSQIIRSISITTAHHFCLNRFAILILVSQLKHLFFVIIRVLIFYGFTIIEWVLDHCFLLTNLSSIILPPFCIALTHTFSPFFSLGLSPLNVSFLVLVSLWLINFA